MLHFRITNATLYRILRIRVSAACYTSVISKSEKYAKTTTKKNTFLWHVKSQNVTFHVM